MSFEYAKYRTHLKSLDDESRVLRFGILIKDEVIDNLCDRIEQHKDNHILFCVEDNDLKFIGIGHIALEGGMELALSVLTDYRRRGIGDALISRCIQYCRTHDILKGVMVCLSHNIAIKTLCKKHNVILKSENGETDGLIILDNPNINTYLNESIAVNSAMVDYVIKRSPINWIK